MDISDNVYQQLIENINLLAPAPVTVSDTVPLLPGSLCINPSLFISIGATFEAGSSGICSGRWFLHSSHGGLEGKLRRVDRP